MMRVAQGFFPAVVFAVSALAGDCGSDRDDFMEQLAGLGAVFLSGECMMITRTGEGATAKYKALATAVPRGGCAYEFLGPGEIITDLAGAKTAAGDRYESVIRVYQESSVCTAPETVLEIARDLTNVDAFNLDASRFLGTSVELKLNFDLQAAAESQVSRCVSVISFLPGSPLYCLTPEHAAGYRNFLDFRAVEDARSQVRVSMEHAVKLHEQARGETNLSAPAAANMALMGISELPLLPASRYVAAALAHLLGDNGCRDEIVNSAPALRDLFIRMRGTSITGVGRAEAASVRSVLPLSPEDPLPACVYGPGAAPTDKIGICPADYELF